MARFNGLYSFRPGYHGALKSQTGGGLETWTCPNGHINPRFELVDERGAGLFVRQQKITICKRCAAQQENALDQDMPEGD